MNDTGRAMFRDVAARAADPRIDALETLRQVIPRAFGRVGSHANNVGAFQAAEAANTLMRPIFPKVRTGYLLGAWADLCSGVPAVEVLARLDAKDDQ